MGGWGSKVLNFLWKYTFKHRFFINIFNNKKHIFPNKETAMLYSLIWRACPFFQGHIYPILHCHYYIGMYFLIHPLGWINDERMAVHCPESGWLYVHPNTNLILAVYTIFQWGNKVQTTYLIFVTFLTYGICGEKFVMWRNFRFLCTTDVEKSEISPHVE